MLASINDGTDRTDLRPETKLGMHAAACRAGTERLGFSSLSKAFLEGPGAGIRELA